MLMPDRLRRFEAKCIPEPMSGCKLWFGYANRQGYGTFSCGGRSMLAHRFAYVASGKSIPAGADLRHSCDTPACVEVSHLIPGSRQDNVDDMWRRKRATVQRRHGSTQRHAKLSEDKVKAIRANATASNAVLAKKYGVSKYAIWAVRNYKSWTGNSLVVIERGRGRD